MLSLPVRSLRHVARRSNKRRHPAAGNSVKSVSQPILRPLICLKTEPCGCYFSSMPKNQEKGDVQSSGDSWRRTVDGSSSTSYEQALAELPDGAQIHFDFFGEPVTFFGVSHDKKKAITNAVAALDGFEIGVVSKGKPLTGGGEEEGIGVKAAHSAAIAWSELLRHAAIWNKDTGKSVVNIVTAAPMLTYVAVAPMLAQTGVGYVGYIDHLLEQVDSGVEGLPPIQVLTLAKNAAAMKDHDHLNPREKAHLQVLDCMLRHEHNRGLMILLKHLQICPGDALALSIAMDLARTVGDKNAALRAAGSVAAYWNERRGTYLRPGIPGHSTASALIALGLAVGGRHAEAEQLATFAMESGKKVSGGISTWALAHIFDAQGRTAEGISACANSDGTRHFEQCGYLFFEAILGGYGVRFALDREERGRGKSAALRLYDSNYERIFDYSGFAQGRAFPSPTRKAPLGWQRSKFEKNDNSNPRSFMQNLFGGGETHSKDVSSDSEGNDSSEVIIKESALPSMKGQNWVPSCEDVFTWMPPTPQLLSDATMLLLRLTLNGTISSQNYRWENIRNAWSVMFELQRRFSGDHPDFEFYPLASVTASLMASPTTTGAGLSGAPGRLAQGLNKMGELLNLGNIAAASEEDSDGDEEDEQSNTLSTMLYREIVADSEPKFWLPVTEDQKREDWQTVLNLLSSAIDGVYHPTMGPTVDMEFAELGVEFSSWEFDVRPVLEHAVVYAACKCGDDQSLSLARSICSRGVTLRSNSPEEWWRYSIVLGLLGDEVASEDALAASIAFGGGQGVRHN